MRIDFSHSPRSPWAVPRLRFWRALLVFAGLTRLLLACGQVDTGRPVENGAGATNHAGGGQVDEQAGATGAVASDGGSDGDINLTGGQSGSGGRSGGGAGASEPAGATGGVNDGPGGEGPGGEGPGLGGVAGGATATTCQENDAIGDVSASSDAELAQVGGLTQIDGDLTLSGSISDLSPLACLKRVTGNLVITGVAAQQVVLPRLAEVGGRVEVLKSRVLANVQLDALLATAGLSLRDLPKLRSASFSHLTECGASGLTISDSSSTPEQALTLNFQALTQVTGNVNLIAVSGLTNLDGFSHLASVSGNVDLTALGGLTNLLGFSSLASVGGNLSLTGLLALTNLLGFSSLTAVGARLVIHRDDALARLDGLANLRQVGQDISITSSAALTSVSLGALTGLGVQSGKTLTLGLLPKLTKVSFPQLVRTPSGGAVSITSCGAGTLPPLELDFPALKVFDGPLSLSSVANLVGLSGLSSVQSLTDLNIKDCNGLESVSLPALTTASNLDFFNNAPLARISLPALITVTTNISLNTLPKLWSVELPQLTGTAPPSAEATASPKALVIYDCTQSASSPPAFHFSALQWAGSFKLSNVHKLATLSGVFPKLSLVSGMVDFTGNDGLLRIEGLDNLTEVGGITVWGNALLTTVDLHTLKRVRGTLSSTSSTAVWMYAVLKLTSVDLRSLTSLDGGVMLNSLSETSSSAPKFDFRSLTELSGEQVTIQNIHKMQALPDMPLINAGSIKNIRIFSNQQLTDLSGFSSIKKTSSLWISSNPLLSTCKAKQMAQSMVIPAGGVTIDGNLADACN